MYKYVVLLLLVYLSACTSSQQKKQVDVMNERAYYFHYRNLDSISHYAYKAMKEAKYYSDGKAEALNHLAFVNTAKMNYEMAEKQLQEALNGTDNQIEQCVSYVMMMRLCQRQSKNKEFYYYKQQASNILGRIRDELSLLNEHQRKRAIFAESEYYIVLSTYFYYIGLDKESFETLEQIDPFGDIQKDTAQWLNYQYTIGSGGILREGTQEYIKQEEFENLEKCYLLARKFGYTYWQANALQGISEHLLSSTYAPKLVKQNASFLHSLVDTSATTPLSVALAKRSVAIFQSYGDVYQTAGAYRTLAYCYWGINDYRKALECLDHSLVDNNKIMLAPDLVASIREALSITYSAINNKPMSDYNRNIYLDIQERTRQDRQLEARAEQLNKTSKELNAMVVLVLLMIAITVVLLFIFDRMRHRKDKNFSLETLLNPLKRWEETNKEKQEIIAEAYEELEENYEVAKNNLFICKKKNIEQRAKIALLQNVSPLIDRMINELNRLKEKEETTKEQAQERYFYIKELAEKLSETNETLTQWIKIYQGEISLKIESFSLQEIFDIVKRNVMSFNLKQINLYVEDTNCVVKADKVLTLFMINTIADNAKKFTPQKGNVWIKAIERDDCIEIAIEDTGRGIKEAYLPYIFNHKTLNNVGLSPENGKGHGFGLMNCKGIIEKYKKISSIFKVCNIGVSSEEGKGSRFYFKLPKGIKKAFILLFLFFVNQLYVYSSSHDKSVQLQNILKKAEMYADSAYYSNVNATYERTILFGDSCLYCLNLYYKKLYPTSKQVLKLIDNQQNASELHWYEKGIKTNYNVILDIRNELAVASLALHQWDLYTYNNHVYTSLFRAKSADMGLGNYVKLMQASETNKNIAIFILILLFILCFPAYYFLYYRHQVYYAFCVDKINQINKVLLKDISVKEKIRVIDSLWNNKIIEEQKEERLKNLSDVVCKIRQSLVYEEQETTKQMAKNQSLTDEINRKRYEADLFYVSNNILDNCLSTFKHETMYYPSKIKQMMEDTNIDIQVIRELTLYYKDLYHIFLLQTMRQLEHRIEINAEMMDYLFSLIKKINNLSTLNYHVIAEQQYVMVHIKIPNKDLTMEQLKDMFSISTHDVRYFICRQIMRELGEEQQARRVGIQASRLNTEEIEILITLTKHIWKSLKLS